MWEHTHTHTHKVEPVLLGWHWMLPGPLIYHVNCWHWTLNERSAEPLFNRSMTPWAVYIGDVDFWKAIFHHLHLMSNTALLFWWMHVMGRAVLEADVWLLWSAAPRENVAFSFALTAISYLSPFLFLMVTLCVNLSYVSRASRRMGAPLCHQGDYWVSVCVPVDVAVL